MFVKVRNQFILGSFPAIVGNYNKGIQGLVRLHPGRLRRDNPGNMAPTEITGTDHPGRKVRRIS